MISMTEARERVARGAAHLDVVRPGWFNRIDVGTLTLHDPCGCIVGQLCDSRNFTHGRESICLDHEAVRSHGMNLTFDDGYEPREKLYEPLQDAWIEAIADRRLSTESNGTPACDAVPVRPTAQMAVSSR